LSPRQAWLQILTSPLYPFSFNLLLDVARSHPLQQLYKGVNITNDLMRNAYQRAMLFLTYIQGPLVNEWVKGVNAWLRGQVIRQRWLTTDERLWDEVQESFNRQFANVMEQENTQAKLAGGLKLE
jgi:hypothetical protein